MSRSFSIPCRKLPAMVTSFNNAYFLLPPNCSDQTSAAVPNRAFRIGSDHHRSLIGCIPQRSVGSSVRVQQGRNKFSPLHRGFPSFDNRNRRPKNGLWHDSSQWSSRRTWKSRDGGIYTASSAVDKTALQEVVCFHSWLCSSVARMLTYWAACSSCQIHFLIQSYQSTYLTHCPLPRLQKITTCPNSNWKRKWGRIYSRESTINSCDEV